MKNGRKLLFFFSDETCGSCASVVPVLAKLAETEGLEFESYICTRRWSWQGKVLPAAGHSHIESFYYLANFYDEILYCGISDMGSFQFRREVLAFGGEVVSARKSCETVEFYREVFARFGRTLPETLVVLPERGTGGRDLAPYCYPEILARDCIALGETEYLQCRDALPGLGVRRTLSFFCSPEGAECADAVRPEDTYGSVTERIAGRYLATGKQIGYIDPDCLMRWQTYFIRMGVLPVYQDYDWEAFIPHVKELADAVGNSDIIGTQVVYNPGQKIVRNNDALIAELGKYSLIHNLVGVNPRIGFTVQTRHPLPLDWLGDPDVPTPWDGEYTDAELAERLANGDIPVCFLFYAADLGHLPVLTNFLNMMCLDGMRAGIAFPCTWYEYQPELVEQLYIPLEQGGVCPNLEPLLSSVGTSVATEAEGYITPALYASLLERARERIAEAAGPRRVPRGYYPFQDASPFYRKEAGQPQFGVVAGQGFSYYVSYLHSEKPAEILYDENGMLAMNQQSPQWFPGYGNPLERLKEWEERCLGSGRKAEWITLGFDTPFFGLTPNYLGQIEYDRMREGWARFAGMNYIYEAMQYVRRKGGDSGKLFLVKPHELARYARLARERGCI